MHNKIVGRNREIAILDSLLKSDRSEFLAVYGRRRVGKTFLINQHLRPKSMYFEVVGSKNAAPEVHLDRFVSEIQRVFGVDLSDSVRTWEEAFDHLRRYILESDDERPIVVFLDELPWIAQSALDFLPALDYCWNKYLSKPEYHKLLLIVCGSAASWMITNIINNKGGLHNRVTRIMRLDPFGLGVCNEYLLSKGIALEHRQIADLYMVLGGVPFYWSLIQKGWSAVQTIDELCFKSNGFLKEEFERLFSSLFSNHQIHVKVVRALAGVRKGVVRSELLAKTGLANGGEVTRALNELEKSGFIAITQDFGSKVKGRVYRLNDEYTLFYLTWIEPVRGNLVVGDQGGYWGQTTRTPAWNAWAGCAFESLCLKHVSAVKTALGIGGIISFDYSFRNRPITGQKGEGVQIDMVIDRADRCINLCEIKYTADEFSITKAYKENLQRMVQVFKTTTKTKKQVFLTFISSCGVVENEHYLAVVQNQIGLEELFGR